MKFYIIDAFTQVAFGGNPAGVIILDENSDFPSEDIMKKTAAELRYSETAFIKQTGEDAFNIRYFTPCEEVDLCGHATIASFWALKDAGICKPGKVYKNQTLAGLINVDVSEDYILMDMAEPEHIATIDDPKALNELYRTLGAKYETVIARPNPGKEAKLLPGIISTGLPDIMLPVADISALMNLDPDFNALAALSERYKVTGVHAFSLGNAEEDFDAHTRNFAPLVGIDEEAATGTSSGALSYYLYEQGLADIGREIEFLQGESMNRPSRILCKIGDDGGKVIIRVGGAGAILAKGEIFL